MDTKQKIEIARDNLYDKLPSGNIDGFELIKIIKEHIKELDTIMDDKMVTLEEKKYNASINRMCSWCGAFADVVIPNKVKLCSKCYEKYNN